MPDRSIILTHVDEQVAVCAGCRAPVRWATTAAGGKITLEADATTQPLRGVGFAVDLGQTHWPGCRASIPRRKQAVRR